jgi:hypothetical protein
MWRGKCIARRRGRIAVGTLLALFLGLCGLILVPIMLVAVVVKVGVALVLLPFKLLGGLLSLGFGLVSGLAKAFGAVLAVLGILFGIVVVALLLPLLPVLLFVGGVFLVAKALSARPAVRVA